LIRVCEEEDRYARVETLADRNRKRIQAKPRGSTPKVLMAGLLGCLYLRHVGGRRESADCKESGSDHAGPILERVWSPVLDDLVHYLRFGAWGTDCRTQVLALAW